MSCRLQGRSKDLLSCCKANPRSHPPLLIPLPPASPSNTQVLPTATLRPTCVNEYCVN
jgi:hypothetical protein